MKNKKLFIFGNSDCASWVKDYFEERSEWEVAGFVADKQYVADGCFCGLKVTESDKCTELYPPEEYFAFVAIGYKQMNRLREEKMQWLKEKGYSLASYIDPSCQYLSTTEIGENCFIMENVAMQPRVRIKDGVFLGTGVCIGHDTTICEYSYVAMGSVVTSYTTVGRNSFIGANATLNNGLKIADYTLVGAGAYITKNTSEYGVYLTEHSRNILRNVEDSKEAQNQFLN